MKRLSTETTNPDTFQGFQGWEKLETFEQNKLLNEVQALEKAADAYEMSNLEVGEHLDNINKILTPKRQFNKWLYWWLKKRKRAKSRAWAYQAMQEYQQIKASTTEPVLEMAKQRGIKLSPHVLVHNPPPKTSDKTQIAKYLDNVRTTRIEVVKSPDTITKEIVNFARLRLESVRDSRSKMKILHAVVGMLLATVGVSNPQSFAPVAIPDSFRAKRGRPPLSQAA